MNTSFEEYDRENPAVWAEFERIALDLIRARGRKHFGAKAICEIIRYQTIITGKDEFKINNNYTSGYARKFVKTYPMYGDFFELRARQWGK